MELVGRLVGLVDLEDLVLEGQQHPRIDLEREVQVERAAAGLLGVEVDLPRLAERVGLDEVPLVVHVEPVVDGVVLEVGDEPGDVDDGHDLSLPRPLRLRYRVTVPTIRTVTPARRLLGVLGRGVLLVGCSSSPRRGGGDAAT